MKAMLVTRCGCARVVDIPEAWPEYRVVLRHPAIAAITPLEEDPFERHVDVRVFLREYLVGSERGEQDKVWFYKEKAPKA